jgi:hypothetical protein
MAIDPQTTDTVTIPQLDPLVLALETFLVGANADGKMGNFTAQELANFISPYVASIGSSGYVPVSGNVLPNPVPGQVKFSIVGAGTFTWSGGSLITTASLNVVTSNGTTWALTVAIPIELKLAKWASGNYALGAQVLHLGQLWEAGVSIVTGETPSLSRKWKPLILNANTNLILGENSTFTNATTDWVTGINSPTLNINGTVANRMVVTFTGATTQSVTLASSLVIGRRYRIIIKSKKISGGDCFISIGNFSSTAGITSVMPKIAPNTTENEFTVYITALATTFSIGSFNVDNAGGVYQFGDVKLFELADSEKIDSTDPKTFGAKGDGVVNDVRAFRQMIVYNANNSILDVVINLKSNSFNLSDNLDFNGFTTMKIIGDGAVFKNSMTSVTPLRLIIVRDGGSTSISGVKVDINNNSSLLHALSVYRINGTLTIKDVEVYNYNNIDQVGIWMQNVTRNMSLAISNTLPSTAIFNCKFYNKQVVNIVDYNYTTSTFKGQGISLDTVAEYVQIFGCNFYGLSEGVRSLGGANSTINTCIFEQCDPTQVSTITGAVNILSAPGNNGKLTISNCKFNHNFGIGIASHYTNIDRGNIITDNHMIVNSWTPIYLSSGGNHLIANNIFNRNNEQQTLTGFPFTVGGGVGIELIDSLRNSIQGNYFNKEMAFAVKSSGSSDRNVLKDNTSVGITTFSSLVGANNVIRNNDAI